MTETYPAFQKIPRLHKDVVITEKIDGTNALVRVIAPDESMGEPYPPRFRVLADGTALAAGSRSRWITPNSDNHGFAAWVWEHAEELAKLGPGVHYGEWWGRGIQRGYNQEIPRFSLFNTYRWSDESGARPDCCHVVPVVATGTGDQLNLLVDSALMDLREFGSQASPGFMNPEGVVIYHTAGNALFKVTFDGDAKRAPALVGLPVKNGKVDLPPPVNMQKPIGLDQFITEPALAA